MSRRPSGVLNKKRPAVTLKAVAARVGLTAGTVSAVLNNSPASRSVPQRTKDRILAAAREMNYRPNFFARSLRIKRTHTIGVIAEEIGDAYGSMVISGIERYLRQRNYFFLTVIHRHDPALLKAYSNLLLQQRVEGFITVDTSISEPPSVPTVAVAGHKPMQGVTNIVLDHRRAVWMALKHLVALGHHEIAFIKGPRGSSDSEDRWEAIRKVAEDMGVGVPPELSVQLESDDITPETGYHAVEQLLARGCPFTALFCYNDLSAFGAIQAIQNAGMRVPDDVSVVGFDDIKAAAYNNPSLTTVRQPLEAMGEIAARTVLDWIEDESKYVPEIAIEPELVVRKSTAAAPTSVMAASMAANPPAVAR
jgi:LacI family transcriptional regulator